VSEKSNIVLIGMPGVGKSTVGVLLAKVLSKKFIDTDVYIQSREGRRLYEIIEHKGLDYFCDIEEKYVASLQLTNTVIATGGSVVYYDSAMQNLKTAATLVYLTLDPAQLIERIRDLTSRGVVIEEGQNFIDLYKLRKMLYEKYADITIDCNGKDHEQVVSEILNQLK
jgi:shikimate kinase